MAEQSGADYRGNLGRYALFGEIAAGGMATVHLARLLSSVGFSRTVAIKRLHPHLAKDPDFVAMFLEEARLATRVNHPNVVSTLDVVNEDGELFLVMEYVPGESLSRLVRKTRENGGVIPLRFVVGVVCGALEGLHAAHEARSERGQPLGIVHRDVSPQNIHVGIDGNARVLDFGIAKATNRVQETRTDQIKGKVSYMSPEQLAKGNVDRRADVYSASVVLWEAITGERLFKADDVPSLVYAIINDDVRPPSAVVPGIPPALDAIVMKGLDREAGKRFSSARAMAEAIERVISPAPAREIGPWVVTTAGAALAARQDLAYRIEAETSTSLLPSEKGRLVHTPSADGYLPAAEESGVVATEGNEGDDSSAEPEDESEADAALPPQANLSDEAGWHVGRVAWIVAAILLIVGGGLFGMRWAAVATEQDESGPSPQPTPDPRAAAIRGAPKTTSASDPEGPAIAFTAGRVAATASTIPRSGASPAPSSTASAASPTPPPVPPPQPRASATTSHECDVPFIIDSRGVRRTKPQCMKR